MLCISRLRTIQLWFLLILPLLAPLSGTCADANGSYAIHGYGADSCGKFVEARKGSRNSVENGLYASWVGGYLTSVNSYYPNTYSISGATDMDGLMLWIENYCNKNPLQIFARAVDALVTELYSKRITQRPK